MLFDDNPKARVYATPLGVDLCSALISGIEDRLADAPPEAWARMEIYVANGRMQRRLHSLFMARGPGLLPRIKPVQALGALGDLAGIPPAIPPLRLRLKLADLIGQLLDRFPDIAPRSAIYDLADSLADLMGEMFEEDVTPEQIASLNVGDHSQHWQRAQKFLEVVAEFLEDEASLTPEARQARVVDALIRQWQEHPPSHPVLVAGSTGSRGATARLMAAVAQLPQGAVILPGLDRDMPRAVWVDLLDARRDGLSGEDHPQFRFAKFADKVGIAPWDIALWGSAEPVNAARSRAVSLALRPAPVTDQWRREGPQLPNLEEAFATVTLVEAPNPQIEATAIALRLREAVEAQERAALITPDRQLARQVTAALDRWGILPDDSAGQPLDLTAPGRFLRHVAEAMTGPLDAEAMIILLKHPICHSAGDRGEHLRRTRDLELWVLRGATSLPTRADLVDWAAKRSGDPGAMDWVVWLAGTLLDVAPPEVLPFADHVSRHLQLAERLAAGSGGDAGFGHLYTGVEGEAVAKLVADLRAEGGAGGMMTARDYGDLISALTRDREARQNLRPHADVLIWGTQEARVQGTEVMILAGLNEGTWPAAPNADPWLNRAMRSDAGLRLPDRVIGLSAHDFQQAMAAPVVWITRAVRDAETDTVPSRWLNRLTNLLGGSGPEAEATLKAMRDRGARVIAQAEALSRVDPVAPAPRPSPCPPVNARPDSLNVTEIEKLIRDPYHIYARRVLRLKPLDPLRPLPDAALRGSVLHDVMERFVRETAENFPPSETARAVLMDIVDEMLSEAAPWPASRRLWRARMARVAGHVVQSEAERRRLGRPVTLEGRAEWPVAETGMTLVGKADRIDRLHDGRYAIFDYKTGKPPTPKQEKAFNKQLWLEALMAEDGAFGLAPPVHVAQIAYLGLGPTPETVEHTPTPEDLAQIRAQIIERLTHLRAPTTGFPSRRAVTEQRFKGDYDHLARFGEWDDTTEVSLIPVGGAKP